MIYAYLAASTAVFMAANALLKTYAGGAGLQVLIGALLLFCLGNYIMVWVMKGGGLGVAISLSAVFQLIAITGLAVVVFGERPSALQMAGMGLGIFAVALIALGGKT
jgi:small multidrug resistance pump